MGYSKIECWPILIHKSYWKATTKEPRGQVVVHDAIYQGSSLGTCPLTWNLTGETKDNGVNGWVGPCFIFSHICLKIGGGGLVNQKESGGAVRPEPGYLIPEEQVPRGNGL